MISSAAWNLSRCCRLSDRRYLIPGSRAFGGCSWGAFDITSYYHHEAESDSVDVLALWHTGRGTGPLI